MLQNSKILTKRRFGSMTLSLIMLTAGCNESAPLPSCSDEEVITNMNSIFQDNLGSTSEARNIFVPKNSTLAVESIATKSQSSQLVECTGIAHITFAFTAFAEQQNDIEAVKERAARARSIDYSVRKTDDGKLLFEYKMDVQDLQ